MIDQRQKVSPPTSNDLQSLQDFASVSQQAFDDVFEVAHTHDIKTSLPLNTDGTAQDIKIVDDETDVYLAVKTERGWFRLSTVGATTNYGLASTIVGWSTLTVQDIYYRKTGSRIDVWYRIVGTSNATTVSFTLPYTNSTTAEIPSAAVIRDNGTFLAPAGYCSLSSNSNLVRVFVDFSGATAFTNSGTKSVQGQFWFYID